MLRESSLRSNGFAKANVECDVGFLVSYTKLLFRGSHTCKREVEVYEPKVLAFEFSLVIVLWFQIEYGKTHKSLGFIMHSKKFGKLSKMQVGYGKIF